MENETRMEENALAIRARMAQIAIDKFKSRFPDRSSDIEWRAIPESPSSRGECLLIILWDLIYTLSFIKGLFEASDLASFFNVLVGCFVGASSTGLKECLQKMDETREVAKIFLWVVFTYLGLTVLPRESKLFHFFAIWGIGATCVIVVRSMIQGLEPGTWTASGNTTMQH
ncbi:hypothetical protein NUW58_g9867 [Xylaria curta]|uniref:Uncharacterized protein n=1 Tax=Xylaria curta TaxID=42375 RepID=A0ACC1MS70_9PEZI|nr:hypothetical protein NUW58_g9867 [Xylaria curta]